MKRKSELRRIVRAFAVCAFVCACLTAFFVFMLRAQANSEFALNGTSPEYTALPQIF